jgi:hypothetical protein
MLEYKKNYVEEEIRMERSSLAKSDKRKEIFSPSLLHITTTTYISLSAEKILNKRRIEENKKIKQKKSIFKRQMLKAINEQLCSKFNIKH